MTLVELTDDQRARLAQFEQAEPGKASRWDLGVLAAWRVRLPRGEDRNRIDALLAKHAKGGTGGRAA